MKEQTTFDKYAKVMFQDLRMFTLLILQVEFAPWGLRLYFHGLQIL